MMRKSQDIYIQEMENNIQKKELNIRDNYEKINRHSPYLSIALHK